MATVAVPLGFDRDEVLERLETLFWTHGYHATTQAQMSGDGVAQRAVNDAALIVDGIRHTIDSWAASDR